MMFSKFCGSVHYGGCIKETRPLFDGANKKSYPICDTCIFKLFLRQLYTEYNTIIKDKEQEIVKEKANFLRVKKDGIELRSIYIKT